MIMCLFIKINMFVYNMIVIIIILVIVAIVCLYLWYTSQTKDEEKVNNIIPKPIIHQPSRQLKPILKKTGYVNNTDKQKMIDDYVNEKMKKGEYAIVDVESAENPHEYNITLKIDYKEIQKTMPADDIIELHKRINQPAPDHIAG